METIDKDELADRFRVYLDNMDRVSPEQDTEEPDLFSLMAELAALKNEVKIESRQVKTALDEFRGLFDTLRQANQRLGDELGRQRTAEARERQDADRDLLLTLLDLHDRMQAGHDRVRRYQPGWLARRAGAAEFVAAIAEGQAMNLRRLDEIFAQRGVRAVSVVGRRFDPQTMHAAEVSRESDRDDGEVLSEIRAGFLHHGRLLRAAEVIVNKKDNHS